MLSMGSVAQYSAGALVLGQVWKDPSNPQWSTDQKFPEGTCVFKVSLPSCLELLRITD